MNHTNTELQRRTGAGDANVKGGDIDSFFSCKSIVVIGASDDPNKIGGTPLALLKKYQFEGTVSCVNPKYQSVQGFPCYASIPDIPGDIDVAIYCLAASTVPAILPQLVDKGLKGLAIFSSGFAEAGQTGLELQEWLAQFAAEHRIAVLGPNCVGMLSFSRSRVLSFANAPTVLPRGKPGRIALLSQSSGVATNIWASATLAGSTFSHLICTGNEAAEEFSDYLDYLAEDPCTDMVVGYIESLRDGQKFCRAAAKIRRKGKFLVLLRAGASALARSAIASHTGQLTTEDAAYQAAFTRCGVIRAHTLDDLVDYTRAFPFVKHSPSVTASTTSGGVGVYIADTCDNAGLAMTRLSADTEEALSKILPSFGRIKNPIDLTAQVVNDPTILARSLKLLLDDPQTGISLFVISGKGLPEQSAPTIATLEELRASTDKPVVVCWLAVPQDVRALASQRGLVVYDDPARFLLPLGALLKQSRFTVGDDAAEHRAVRSPIETVEIDSMMEMSASGRAVLPESASLGLLRLAGVDCPATWRVREETDVRAIEFGGGRRFVLKIAKPVMAHKSEVGGVVVNLASTEDLLSARRRMMDILNATEIIVAEQIEEGIELIVGCARDLTFGARITVGAGGVWAEFLKDAVTLVPPLTTAYVLDRLAQLGVWGVLSGARNQRQYAVNRVVEAIQAIAETFASLPGAILEFECNPIIVTPERAVVVDAVGYAAGGANPRTTWSGGSEQ